MTRTTTAAALAALLALAACAKDDGTQAGADTAAPAIDGGTPATTTAAGTDSATPAATAAAGGLLDPNAATRDQLVAIPGMDAALADSLVATRPHADMRAVDRVLAARLGEPQRDSVYTRLFLPLDLNKATRDEIELIPGVGRRLSHEFEEYRPYRTIEQFRREIGKYVKADEVARLERYVVVRPAQ